VVQESIEKYQKSKKCRFSYGHVTAKTREVARFADVGNSVSILTPLRLRAPQTVRLRRRQTRTCVSNCGV